MGNRGSVEKIKKIEKKTFFFEILKPPAVDS
jgi:hypothetical protein